MKRSGAASVAAAILLLVSLCAALPPANPAPKKTLPRGTVIFRVMGVVAKKGAKPANGKKKATRRLLPAYVRTTVKPGDVVRTNGRSRAEIHLGEGVIIRLKENARLKLGQFETTKKIQRASLRLISGKILLKISKTIGVERRIKVRTPTAVATVRGTVFIVDVAKPAETDIKVLEGTVHTSLLSASGAEEPGGRDVEAGTELAAVQGQPLAEPVAIPSEEAVEDAQWSQAPEMEAPDEQQNDEQEQPESEVQESQAPETVEPQELGPTGPAVEESEPDPEPEDSEQ